MYLYLKALHIIFIVTWFAGLFYIVRLFIYQIEANEKPEPDRTIIGKQLAHMARLLWRAITWPSALLTLIFGTSLIVTQPEWLKMPFMHLKLTFVGLLYGYHFSCQYIFTKLQKGDVRWTSTQLRLWNEVATILLVAIVFLIVVKDQLSWVWGVVGIALFAIILMLAIRVYKKLREAK